MAERPRGYALRVDIDADAQRVWHVLTDPKCIARWCSADARLTLRSGGSFRVTFEPPFEANAHIDVFDPGRRIRMIYLASPSLPEGDTAVVDDIILESRPPQTVVRVLGAGFSAGREHEAAAHRHNKGWRRALARLKVMVEKNLDLKEAAT
jgi:uncharacterized protein YndB with AHSA1/START domain